MNIQDPVSDMLCRVRNALGARRVQVIMPASRIKISIAEILKREGYIKDFERRTSPGGHAELLLTLKYHEARPVIKELRRVSKPSCRVYRSHRELPRVHRGLGIAVISTSFGLLTDHEARKRGVGGEVVCLVA